MKSSQMSMFGEYEVVIGAVTFRRGGPAVSIIRVEGALHIRCHAKNHVSKLALPRVISSQIIFTKCAVYR